MEVLFTDTAEADLEFRKLSGNISILNKIENLIKEIAETPYTGTGKPEQLKHDMAGFWSRWTNKEHRLIYCVENDTITVTNIRWHYK